MTYIKSISDLRDKYTKKENVCNGGHPTKDGYSTKADSSLEENNSLIGIIELKLDEADIMAEKVETRYSHKQVFGKVRKIINER